MPLPFRLPALLPSLAAHHPGPAPGATPVHPNPPAPPAGFLQRGTSGPDAITGTGTSRVVLGLAGNDTLTGSASKEHIDGGDGDDRLVGGAGDDVLSGGRGRDSLNGGDGADRLAGGPDSDTLTGGAGADLFLVGGRVPTTAADLDRITDFTHGQDLLVFGPGGATAASFATATAASYAEALTAANTRIASGAADYVAVKVGADVVVFADTHRDNGTADAAVMLVGRSLTDISFGDIHAPTPPGH